MSRQAGVPIFSPRLDGMCWRLLVARPKPSFLAIQSAPFIRPANPTA